MRSPPPIGLHGTFHSHGIGSNQTPAIRPAMKCPKRGDEGGWSIGNPDARHPYAIAPDHPAAKLIGTTLPLTDNPPSGFEPWMGVWFPVDTGPNILVEMAPEAWARWKPTEQWPATPGR